MRNDPLHQIEDAAICATVALAQIGRAWLAVGMVMAGLGVRTALKRLEPPPVR